MLIQNGIPVSVLIFETLIASFMLTLAIKSIIRHNKRRKEVSFYLYNAILFYSLTVICSSIGKYIDFFSPPMEPGFSKYTDIFINIAYCCLAITNYYLFAFTKEIFFDEKKEKLNIILAIMNGLSIGLIIFLLIAEPQYFIFMSVYCYFTIILFSTNGLIFYLSLQKGIKKIREKDHMTAVGFLFIGLVGFFTILVVLLFGIGLIIGERTSRWYTSFFYLGWLSAACGAFSAYIGYFLPSWITRWLTK